MAALWHPHAYSDRTMATLLQDTRAAAQTLGMRLELVPAAVPDGEKSMARSPPSLPLACRGSS